MEINRKAIQFGKLYTEGYGPYTDGDRLQAVFLAKQIGCNPAAKQLGMSPESIRRWALSYQLGPVHSNKSSR